MPATLPLLPTIRTPRSPHRYSDGRLVGAIIAAKLGRRPTRWQQYVLDVGLERVDGPGSPFAYANVDLIVGRRCGKSVTTMGVPLARSLAGPVVLDTGRVMPFLGAHTAQNLVKARQRFLKDLVEPYRESMSGDVWRSGVKLREAIGDTSLTIDPATAGKDWRLRRSSQIQVFAPTRSSVRGDGLMHLTFDEWLVFTRLLGQELLAAAGPTLGDARGHGQIWRCTNISVLNNEQTAVWETKESGRTAVDAGLTSGTAYFEFTIPEGSDVTDERMWPEWYPGILDGLIRIEELREDLKRLGPESFGAEYFGLWPGAGAIVKLWETISRGSWEAAGVPADEFEMPEDVPGALGVDIDPFDRSATITATSVDPTRDGLVQEVIDDRPGSSWIMGRLRDLEPTVNAIGIDDYGPGHDLILDIERDEPAIARKLVKTTAQDFSAACFAWDSRLGARGVRIRKSDEYAKATQAAGAAQRTSGKAWQWERRLPVPQTPITSATLSAWALGRAPEPETFFVY